MIQYAHVSFLHFYTSLIYQENFGKSWIDVSSSASYKQFLWFTIGDALLLENISINNARMTNASGCFPTTLRTFVLLRDARNCSHVYNFKFFVSFVSFYFCYSMMDDLVKYINGKKSTRYSVTTFVQVSKTFRKRLWWDTGLIAESGYLSMR